MNRLIFDYLFAFSKNPHIANIALFFSYYLVFAIPAILIAWSLFFAPRKIYSFALFFVSGMGAFLLSLLLKVIFLVDRPYVRWDDVMPLVKVMGFSFPSGHAATMAGLASAGYFLNPRLGIVLIIFAVLIGLSRIVIGVHDPVDVLSGWIIGGLVSVLFITLFKKI